MDVEGKNGERIDGLYPAIIASDPRRYAKAIGLGLAYGAMGGVVMLAESVVGEAYYPRQVYWEYTLAGRSWPGMPRPAEMLLVAYPGRDACPGLASYTGWKEQARVVDLKKCTQYTRPTCGGAWLQTTAFRTPS